MKTLLLMLFISTQIQSNQADDEAQLRLIKTQLWPQAYLTQDVALLDSILHQSFQMYDANGALSTRNKELDYVKHNEFNPGEFQYVIERLDVYQGKTAVVSGSGHASRYTYKSSNFFIKENGQWRAIASHVSGYQEKNIDQ